VKQSLQERIKAFHDGTAAIEDAFDVEVVPVALRPDAAFFQKDRDQIEWFRQMEAIEVQELALRFLQAPEHAAFQENNSSQSMQEVRAAEKTGPGQDETLAAPDSRFLQEMAEEVQSVEDEADHDAEVDLAPTTLPLGEAEDPQALVTWLREISSEIPNPNSMPSNEFARGAVENRYRAGVSRKKVVTTLMALRRSGVSGLGATVNELETSWSNLEAQLLRHNVRAALHWANLHGGALPDGLAFVLALAGMRRAVRAFEPDLGWKFLTYASWWIRQSVQRGRVDYGTALRIPVHLSERLSLVKRVTSGCSLPAAQDLSNTEILTAMGKVSERVLPNDDLERLRHLDRRQRLSDVVDPGEPVLAIDYLFDESRWTPTEVAPDESHRGSLAIGADALIEAVECELSKSKTRARGRSRAVVYERLGLDGQASRPTLEQLGQRFEITRERIRQVEMKGFKGICKTLGIATGTQDD
jgi:hypothetical protein